MRFEEENGAVERSTLPYGETRAIVHVFPCNQAQNEILQRNNATIDKSADSSNIVEKHPDKKLKVFQRSENTFFNQASILHFRNNVLKIMKERK